jgi:hypothetical protein
MTIFEELMALRNERLRIEQSLLKSVLLKISAHESHTLSADELERLNEAYGDIEDLHEMMFRWLSKNNLWS